MNTVLQLRGLFDFNFLDLLILLYVYEGFAYIHVHAPHVCLLESLELRLWMLCASIWVLGEEPKAWKS